MQSASDPGMVVVMVAAVVVLLAAGAVFGYALRDRRSDAPSVVETLTESNAMLVNAVITMKSEESTAHRLNMERMVKEAEAGLKDHPDQNEHAPPAAPVRHDRSANGWMSGGPMSDDHLDPGVYRQVAGPIHGV